MTPDELAEAEHRAEWQQKCQTSEPATLQYYYEQHTRRSLAAPHDRLAMIRAQSALVEGARRNQRLTLQTRTS